MAEESNVGDLIVDLQNRHRVKSAVLPTDAKERLKNRRVAMDVVGRIFNVDLAEFGDVADELGVDTVIDAMTKMVINCALKFEEHLNELLEG